MSYQRTLQHNAYVISVIDTHLKRHDKNFRVSLLTNAQFVILITILLHSTRHGIFLFLARFCLAFS